MYNATAFRLPPADLAHIEQGLGDSVEGLRNASVLLTGASGFFGMWMLESLVWLNQSRGLHMALDVVVRDPTTFNKKASPPVWAHTRILEGDLATLDIEPQAYKYIIHLASEAIQTDRKPSFFDHLQKSVLAANRLIALADRCKTEAILFTSSGAVYGDYLSLHAAPSSFKENIQTATEVFNEKAIYAETKRYIELLFSTASARYPFDIKIARCFSFLGPFLPLHSNYAVGNFIRDALAGNDILIKGNGRTQRSYLYAADLVVLLLQILLKGRPGIPYNVGSPDAVSMLELATKVRDLSGSKAKVCVLNQDGGSGAADCYLPDLNHVRQDFSLSGTVALNDAISRTIAWNRACWPSQEINSPV
jgi:nucleoside-diphosphate-sugar epimerase